MREHRRFASEHSRVCGAMSSESLEPRLSSVTLAGLIIRYGFFIVGALVLSAIGADMFAIWKIQPTPIDDPPAFRVAASSLTQLPVSGHVIGSGRYGRIEVRQYGRLSNRDVDLAVVMVMPRKGIGMGTQFVQDLRDVNLLRSVRATMVSTH